MVVGFSGKVVVSDMKRNARNTCTWQRDVPSWCGLLWLLSLSPKPFLATEYIKAAVVTGGFRYLLLLRTPSLPVATQCLQVYMRGTPFINRAPLCMDLWDSRCSSLVTDEKCQKLKKEICSPFLVYTRTNCVDRGTWSLWRIRMHI